MNATELRDHIRSTIEDLVGAFLYYDRKEDEDLPRGAIEGAIEDETITATELVEWFGMALEDGLS